MYAWGNNSSAFALLRKRSMHPPISRHLSTKTLEELWTPRKIDEIFIYRPYFILWNLRLSRRWRWRCCSYGLWRCVDSHVNTNVSAKHTVSIFRADELRWRQHVSPKRWYLPASLYGVTTHKKNTVTFNFLLTILGRSMYITNLRWSERKTSRSVTSADSGGHSIKSIRHQ
jgi:hypothetical protein